LANALHDHQFLTRRLPNWKPISLAGSDATVLNSPMHSTSSLNSSRVVDVTLPSSSDRSMSKRSSVRIGVGRRKVTVGERVLPVRLAAQLWCWVMQSKKTARKPPFTSPGGPS